MVRNLWSVVFRGGWDADCGGDVKTERNVHAICIFICIEETHTTTDAEMVPRQTEKEGSTKARQREGFFLNESKTKMHA